MSEGRVLVVDDEAIVRDVLTRYLEREGFRVDVAEDGEVALELAARSRPDIVVLDLMLPKVDGLEVFRRLRDVGDVPVVMLTAKGEEVDRLVGLELGADDYVSKPFSPGRWSRGSEPSCVVANAPPTTALPSWWAVSRSTGVAGRCAVMRLRST